LEKTQKKIFCFYVV